MTRSAEAQRLSLGVLARSRKANERRLPIHPLHFSRIDRRVRQRIFLEHGYRAKTSSSGRSIPGGRRPSGVARGRVTNSGTTFGCASANRRKS